MYPAKCPWSRAKRPFTIGATSPRYHWKMHLATQKQLSQRPFNPPRSSHLQRFAPALRALHEPFPRSQHITPGCHCFLPTTFTTHKRKWPGLYRHRSSPENLFIVVSISALSQRDTPAQSADQTLHHTHSTHAECARRPRRFAQSLRAAPIVRTTEQESPQHHTEHPTSARR